MKKYKLTSKNKYLKSRFPDETHKVFFTNAAIKPYKIVVLQFCNARLYSGNKMPFSSCVAKLLPCVNGQSSRSRPNSMSLPLATYNMSQNIKYLHYHHSPVIYYWLFFIFLWEEDLFKYRFCPRRSFLKYLDGSTTLPRF